MANEITITVGIGRTSSTDNFKVPTDSTTRQFTQGTARGGGPGVIDIGTSEESISFGDCVPGYTKLENLDTTNYVEYYFTTAAAGAILPASGLGLIYIKSGQTLYMKANTATCKVKITALNQ